MTMLEAIKAVARLVEWPGPNRPCPVCDDNRYLTAAITAAESEAKREAEAFERAREAWGVRSHGLITMTVADACDVLDAYFATGEKDG
jgi:hypothetical protein